MSETDDDNADEGEGGAAERIDADPEADPDAKAKAKAEAKARVLAEARERAKATAEESTALAKPDDVADRRDLPKWNRARVKRKAPVGEEQDAFQASVRQAGRGAVRRAPLLLGVLVLIAGTIGGFVWWRSQSSAKAADATAKLAVAAGYQARGRIEPNLDTVLAERARPPAQLLVKDEAMLRQTIDDALRELDQTASGSAPARLAELVRASRAMREARFSDAASQFTSFLDAHPSHDLAFLAREGLLLALEAQGDTDGALAQAEALIGSETGRFFRDQGLWHKGRIYEAVGRGDEALAVYKQYADEYPLNAGSIARAQVIERLRELDPSIVPAGVEADAGDAMDLSALFQ